MHSLPLPYASFGFPARIVPVPYPACNLFALGVHTNWHKEIVHANPLHLNLWLCGY